MNSFIKENAADLEAFSRMSQCAGARNDYVQGGGGNTSAKLAGGLMGIKASGYCLSDITPETAYAVLDYEALRRFYYGNEPEQLADVEKQGSAFARENTKQIECLPTLRPSVEAGFHSILRKFVCHTHSVYANFACCSTACCEIAEKAFAGADYSWGWVPYTDPGANLTFAIRRELARVEHATGPRPGCDPDAEPRDHRPLRQRGRMPPHQRRRERPAGRPVRQGRRFLPEGRGKAHRRRTLRGRRTGPDGGAAERPV